MPWAILDTGVYIDQWERGLYDDALTEILSAFVIRHSAVVLSELRRGARTRQASHLVDSLFRLAAVQWEPSASDWWEAGQLIQRIGDVEHWDLNKRRSFQNDALIALTARRHGAIVVTTNGTDFGFLSEALRISILPLGNQR